MKRLISLQHQNLQNITKFRFSSHELYEKYQEFLQKKTHSTHFWWHNVGHNFQKNIDFFVKFGDFHTVQLILCRFWWHIQHLLRKSYDWRLLIYNVYKWKKCHLPILTLCNVRSIGQCLPSFCMEGISLCLDFSNRAKKCSKSIWNFLLRGKKGDWFCNSVEFALI